MTINAFHPDYVKTHMPQFLTAVKQVQQYATSATNLSKTVTNMRKIKPSHGNVAGISKSQRESVLNQKFQDISAFPKTQKKQTPLAMFVKALTPAQKARLAPRDFHMFSKAGVANTTKTKK